MQNDYPGDEFGTTATTELSEEMADSLESALKDFARDADLSLAVAVDAGGALLAGVSSRDDLDVSAVCALAAGVHAAGKSLARAIGEEVPTDIIQHGEHGACFIHGLEGLGLLLAVADGNTPVGLLRHRAAEAVADILSRLQASTAPAPVAEIPEPEAEPAVNEEPSSQEDFQIDLESPPEPPEEMASPVERELPPAPPETETTVPSMAPFTDSEPLPARTPDLPPAIPPAFAAAAAAAAALVEKQRTQLPPPPEPEPPQIVSEPPQISEKPPAPDWVLSIEEPPDWSMEGGPDDITAPIAPRRPFVAASPPALSLDPGPPVSEPPAPLEIVESEASEDFAEDTPASEPFISLEEEPLPSLSATPFILDEFEEEGDEAGDAFSTNAALPVAEMIEPPIPGWDVEIDEDPPEANAPPAAPSAPEAVPGPETPDTGEVDYEEDDSLGNGGPLYMM